jgi:hypothetical protein
MTRTNCCSKKKGSVEKIAQLATFFHFLSQVLLTPESAIPARHFRISYIVKRISLIKGTIYKSMRAKFTQEICTYHVSTYYVYRVVHLLQQSSGNHHEKEVQPAERVRSILSFVFAY